MPQRWSQVLLSLVASALLFASCKKEYSPDEVLPIQYSPSVIIGNDNQVIYGVNPSNGEKNWERGLSFRVKASPIVYNGSVYVVSPTRDSVVKINSRTGVVTKKFSFGGGAGATATPIADGKLLYIASLSGWIYAMDTGTGEIKWSYGTNGPIESSPTIHNGNIYVMTTMGGVYRFEKTNGTTVSPPGGAIPTWELIIPEAKFVSSPAVAAPYLFAGSMSDSTMYCIYLDEPTVRWRYKTRGGIRSSPAAYGGTCIFGSNDFRLYCLDTTIDPPMGQFTPEPRWIDSMHSEITSSPFASNQTVYVGCKDYKVYALKIINGATKWTFPTNGIVTSSPLVYGGKVFVASYDKHIYALDTLRGTLKWKYNTNGQIDCSPVLDDFSKPTGYNSQISGFTN